MLKLTPEVKAEIFDLLSGHYDAIILETFRIGGIPEYDDSFEKGNLLPGVDSGETIAVTTQVPEERLLILVYIRLGKNSIIIKESLSPMICSRRRIHCCRN